MRFSKCSLFFLTFIIFFSFEVYADIQVVSIPRIDAKERIRGIELEISQLQMKLKNIDNNSANQEPIIEINAAIDGLNREFSKFKKLILRDPESALSFQSLKNELEFLKKDNQQIRMDMSNYLGLSKWFIGSLVTLSVAIIGLLGVVMFREVKLSKTKKKPRKK